MPVIEPPRIPITLVTGYLGAGKTTLLNRILTSAQCQRQRVAVIENEIGAVGVDRSLIDDAERSVFEMVNGCLCCTIRGDLIRALTDLGRRTAEIDRVIVETTGLADPGPVMRACLADRDICRAFCLDAVVTVVDCKHLPLHLADSQEAAEQLRMADVIILNKTDLVSAAEAADLEARIRPLNPAARVVRAHRSAVPMDVILDVGSRDEQSRRHRLLARPYPFRYAAAFSLLAGRHTLTMEEGPSDSIAIALLPATDPESLAAEVARAAQHLFSIPATAVEPGGEIRLGETNFLFDLERPGVKQFAARVAHAGNFVLFAEHLPERFYLRLIAEAGVAQVPIWERRFTSRHTHTPGVSSVAIEAEGALDGARLERWLRALLDERGGDIFRSKGLLNVDGDSRRFSLQGVHALFTLQPGRSWDADRRVSQLVFIGRHLDRAALTAGLQGCLRSSFPASKQGMP